MRIYVCENCLLEYADKGFCTVCASQQLKEIEKADCALCSLPLGLNWRACGHCGNPVPGKQARPEKMALSAARGKVISRPKNPV
jgi:hypothetical protein